MKIFDMLIIGLIFMALFPTIWGSFNNPVLTISTQGNNATWTNTTAIYYPTLYNTMFSLLPLLVVIGIIWFFYHKQAVV